MQTRRSWDRRRRLKIPGSALGTFGPVLGSARAVLLRSDQLRSVRVRSWGRRGDRFVGTLGDRSRKLEEPPARLPEFPGRPREIRDRFEDHAGVEIWLGPEGSSAPGHQPRYVRFHSGRAGPGNPGRPRKSRPALGTEVPDTGSRDPRYRSQRVRNRPRGSRGGPQDPTWASPGRRGPGPGVPRPASAALGL
jgi:hypothetical protein